MSDVNSIDPCAVRRWRNLPTSASPWLHEEVARRMLPRLDWIRLQPLTWAHWQPLRGGLQAHAALVQRYPRASCIVFEEQPERAQFAARALGKAWWQVSRWREKPTRFEMPGPGSVQMLWSNMALHLSDHPHAVLAQWQRALAVDGFLMFSCLGPDSLMELRSLYRRLGWGAPAHEFTDMHDWGDMLLANGFAEPVMDMERITLSFETPERLLQELRGLGRNLHVQRFAALRGRGWLAQLRQALAQEPLQLTFELIYGHAIKPGASFGVSAQREIPLAEMRAALSRSQVGSRQR